MISSRVNAEAKKNTQQSSFKLDSLEICKNVKQCNFSHKISLVQRNIIFYRIDLCSVLGQYSRMERTWVVESYRVEFKPLPLDKLNGIEQFTCKQILGLGCFIYIMGII